jgi:hypothetical protein
MEKIILLCQNNFINIERSLAMANNLIGLLLLVVIILGLMLLFNVYTKFLAKLSAKQLQKKLESGKISDEKLVKLYHTYKKQKSNKFMAILMAGIFYKSYLKIPEAAYNLYKQEMIKRNLSL